MKEETSPRILIHSQYVRDLSFEGPQDIASLSEERDPPKVNISFDFTVEDKGDMREGFLSFKIDASTKKGNIFIMELSYCGMFSLVGIPEDQQEAVLFTVGAPMLFPFARQIIATTIANAGFPPVMIDPINFLEFYRSKKSHANNNGFIS